MGRNATGYWDDRSKRYYARLGEISPKSGKRKAMMLCEIDGGTIGYGEHGKVASAIQRRLAELAEEDRRKTGPTVQDICQQFIEWHETKGSAQRTIDDHFTHLAAFCAFSADGVEYAKRPAASIGIADLSKHRRAMEARGNQTGYVKLRYASILACWRWAARPHEDREPVRLIPANPSDGLPRPARGRGRNQALPWSITRRLLRFAWGMAKQHPYHRQSDRDAERVRILRTLYTALAGSRPSEAAQLRWSDINWEQRIVVQHGKTTTRTGKMRRTPLTESMAKALRRLERWPGRHPEYVFLTSKTRKTTVPNSHECAEWFRLLRERLIAGPMPDLPGKVTLYWLRHEYQSFGLEVASVEAVSAAAGNSPQVLLSTYAHVGNKRIVEVGDTIDRGRRAKKS